MTNGHLVDKHLLRSWETLWGSGHLCARRCSSGVVPRPAGSEGSRWRGRRPHPAAGAQPSSCGSTPGLHTFPAATPRCVCFRVFFHCPCLLISYTSEHSLRFDQLFSLSVSIFYVLF